jgi:hypothetical protein
MSKEPKKHNQAWTRQEVNELRSLAKHNKPTRLIAWEMERTPAAIYTKASEENISLKPTNQSPYNRRKK